jgi:acetylornithine/succinyldiaminopimelate/putrescine aminotransferase
VVAAAALAALEVIDHPGRLARVMELGLRLADGLRGLPGVEEVRARGLMAAFETPDAPRLVRRALSEQRLVLNATGPTTVRLLPPLIVTEDEVDEAVARLNGLLG